LDATDSTIPTDPTLAVLLVGGVGSVTTRYSKGGIAGDAVGETRDGGGGGGQIEGEGSGIFGDRVDGQE